MFLILVRKVIFKTFDDHFFKMKSSYYFTPFFVYHVSFFLINFENSIAILFDCVPSHSDLMSVKSRHVLAAFFIVQSDFDSF